jgi:Beta propeller domain/Dockerin type I domain
VRALGHVSIPGFSSYMQFISPNRLLTIGTNTPTGFDGRAMVSLFDVSNLTSPRLIDQYNLPKYATSVANNDHHAFGWFANHELLSVPVARHFAERHDADGDGYKEAFRFVRGDELSILHVGVDDNGVEGITLRGQVVHDAQVDRSVSINNHIYSVGVDGVRVVNVNDANTIVDQVLFDWTIDIDDEPGIAFDHTVYATAARDLLAGRGVSRGNLLLVTQERHDGEVELVLRNGANHYRLRGTSDKTLEVIDEAFAFIDNIQHNTQNALDANNDGKVTALDALMVINEMNRRGQSNVSVSQVLRQVGSSISSFTDVTGDGQITANDALSIINELARQQAQSLPNAEKITSSVDEYFRYEDEVRLF